MPSLYRCRTSLPEVAALFGATPPARADWSVELWPRRTAPHAATMPAIVLPEEYDAWLGGDLRIAGRIARQQRAYDEMYREPTEA